MSFEGTIVNGNVVLDEPSALAEGPRMDVVAKAPVEAASDLGAMLLRHAGKAKGLPTDAAEQHDHYLYGTPKR